MPGQMPILPSWRPGPARDSIVDFLAASAEVRPEQRLAVFDNDGTLWCEKPRYPQLDFLIWQLRRSVAQQPDLNDVPEYALVLAGDQAAMAELGLERVALALLRLFEDIEPEVFEERVRTFFAETRHPDHDRRYDQMVYQPMLELLAALESHGFSNSIVSGGGTEFVRAISPRVYGIPPERVVGTLVTYALVEKGGRPLLLRTAEVEGKLNEGGAKIENIQTMLGRRPLLAAGNSPGDADMLEYTNSRGSELPSLALLVNHDDDRREYAYESVAGSFESPESIGDTAARLGWTQISMKDDWATIFPGP
jgi:phosphoglycolate phosphatase-like HAD superfamily hydrolase